MSSARVGPAVVLWAAYWIAYFAVDPDLGDVVLWIALLAPNFALGLATGRWWTALLPFALVFLVPLAPEPSCVDVDCGETAAIPAWVVVLTYVAPRGALAVLAGVACRRLLERRPRRAA